MFIKKKSPSKSSTSTTYKTQHSVDGVDLNEQTNKPKTNTLMRALEPRIMLDAALVDTLVEGHAPVDSSPFKNSAEENRDAKAANLLADYAGPAANRGRIADAPFDRNELAEAMGEAIVEKALSRGSIQDAVEAGNLGRNSIDTESLSRNASIESIGAGADAEGQPRSSHSTSLDTETGAESLIGNSNPQYADRDWRYFNPQQRFEVERVSLALDLIGPRDDVQVGRDATHIQSAISRILENQGLDFEATSISQPRDSSNESIDAGGLPRSSYSTSIDTGTDESLEAGTTQQPTSVVIIDSAVEDKQTLINGIDQSTTDIHILDANSNGAEQIANILAQYNNLEAVHIISHGGDGYLELGNDRLDGEDLRLSPDLIRGWGDALSASGDILLYGCNVAETATGEAFVNQLAEITQADVAASDDVTGAADQDGDWELEYQISEDGLLDMSLSENWRSYQGVFGIAEVIAGGASAALWIDASDPDADGTAGNNPANGSLVSSISDKSGNGNNLSLGSGDGAAYTTGAMNGRAVFTFDGSEHYQGNIGATSGAATVFAVFLDQAGGAYEYVYSWGTNGNNSLTSMALETGTNNYYVYNGAAANFSSTVIAENTRTLIVQDFDNSAQFHQTFVNGAETTQTDNTGALGIAAGAISSRVGDWV